MGNTNTKEEEKKLGSVVVSNNSNTQPVQNTQNNASTLKGVDEATTAKMNSSFTASDTYNDADADAKNALGNYKNIAGKTSIVSDNVWNTLNSSFSVPTAVTEADAYLKNQLSQIQSGKTSYTDQVKNMMSQIQGREDFSYDVDNDPLFQQALASAMNSGKQAMQDAMGQASSLTGGYGSTYATTAGNQAYNSFIQDAYDNLPQYYQMAMEAYQMEGDEMYRQLDMLNNADSTEYARMVNAYDTTSAYRDRRYDEAYTQFRDTKTDALNMANLQLSEHGQLSSDALNLYNATSSYAENIYQKEYTKWSDEVNQAMQYGQMLNSDYWQQTTFDEDVRQYEQNYAEEQRQFDETYKQNDEHFYKGLEHESTENQLDRDFTSDESQKDRDWKTDESQKDRDFTSSENQKDRDWKDTDREDNQAWNDADREDSQAWQDANREDEQTWNASQNALDRNKSVAAGGGNKPTGLSTAEYNVARKAWEDANGGEEGFVAAVSSLEAMGITVDDALATSLQNSFASETEEVSAPAKTGAVAEFRTKEGDNFEITVGDSTYKVENHGKEADNKTIDKLNKMSIEEGTAFVYNGQAYVKHAGGYFKVGARAFGNKAYESLVSALAK